MEPVQLIHKVELDKLILVSKVGTSEDKKQTQLAVFNIDFINLKVELLHQYTVQNFHCS